MSTTIRQGATRRHREMGAGGEGCAGDAGYASVRLRTDSYLRAAYNKLATEKICTAPNSGYKRSDYSCDAMFLPSAAEAAMDEVATQSAFMSALTTEHLVLQTVASSTISEAAARSCLYVFSLSSSLPAVIVLGVVRSSGS